MRIRKMNYEEITTKDYEAVCPFCKNTDFREPGDMPWDENEPEYITCPQCGKHFVLTPIYDFKGWKSESDEDYPEEMEDE